MRAAVAIFGVVAAGTIVLAQEAFALNLTPPHGRHVAPARLMPVQPPEHEPVTDCDRLAASPEDGQKVANGVSMEALDAGLALARCEEAVGRYPAVGRLQFQLGRAQEKLGNDAAALEAYRKGAELGSLIAAFSAGVRERDGVGTPSNDVEANRLFKLCADKGDADCLNSLAYQYQVGRGVNVDPAEAMALYKKAAEAGLVAANVNLGFLYRDGEGVAQDYTEAARQFQLAADKGDPAGARNLALLYQNGQGVPKDGAKAVALLQAAADQGDDDALVKIAYAYLSGDGVSKDEAKSVTYYRLAADRGNTDGMAGLAFAYANGRGVAADGKAAALWLMRALAAGNEYAFTQLTDHWGAWSADTRTQVQSILADRGLYGGKPDGALNRETLKALKILAGREN